MTAIPKHIQEVYEKSTCLFTTHEIEGALDRMAINITRDLENKNPVILSVMIGGMIPTGNLLPRLNFPLEVDYVHATRYKGATKGGALEWKARPSTNLKDRTILIVDDILDRGVTLAQIIKELQELGPKEILTAVLVDKKCNREKEGYQEADYVGLEVDDSFIFGYGMDYNEYLRNVPGIFVVAPEHE